MYIYELLEECFAEKHSFYCGSLVHCPVNPELPLHILSASPRWEEDTPATLKPKHSPPCSSLFTVNRISLKKKVIGCPPYSLGPGCRDRVSLKLVGAFSVLQ